MFSSSVFARKLSRVGLAALAERHGARSAAAPAGGAAPSGDAALSAAS